MLGVPRGLHPGGRRGRHADFYLCAPAGHPLALERENLLAVCDNALGARPATPQSVARALGALVALEPDVVARGPAGITLPRLERALGQAEALGQHTVQWAEALAVRGRASLEAGQLAAARRELERAREALGALGALGALAREKRLLVDLSIVARHEGDVASAWSLVRQAQELPSGGDRWLEAYVLGNLGIVELVRGGAVAALDPIPGLPAHRGGAAHGGV